MEFQRPTTTSEATALLHRCPHRILAGGTDVFPALQGKSLAGPVLDITAITSLRSITESENHWSIGALATWASLSSTPLPPAFRALQQAACEIGSIQIQNRATLAGNICNASPAADGMPPLLALDAEVELTAHTGQRRLPLLEFVTGNRKSSLRPDELLTAILIPKQAATGRSTFAKLGARRYLVISIAMLAVRLAANDGRITACAIAVGACSTVAQRLRRLEALIVGQSVADLASQPPEIEPRLLDGLSPISDVRSPASYRLAAVAELTGRTLQSTAKDVLA